MGSDSDPPPTDSGYYGENMTHSCAIFKGDTHKCNTIIAAKRVTASLSLVACVLVIFIIILFRKFRSFTQRLILYLTIAAFFDCIMYIMGDDFEPGPVCNFQAWGLTYFDWSVLLWVCCITFNLYMVVIRQVNTDQIRFEGPYSVIAWGVPMVISVIPLFADKYVPTGFWCWVANDGAWRFLMWYVPLFLLLAAMVSVYIYIIFQVKRKNSTWGGHYNPDQEHNKRELIDQVSSLKWYPLIYLAVSIFPLINRIHNAASPDASYPLTLLHTIFVPANGTINAIIFGMDRETLSKLRPSEIRMAVQSWRHRDDNIIREYPAVNESSENVEEQNNI